MNDYVAEYDNAPEEDLHDFRQRLSQRVTTKLRQYLQDWDNGDTYRYFFGLTYLLAGFGAGSQKIEYINITKDYIDAQTITEAVAAAKEWEAQLLERITLYKDQERGHKGGGDVRPTYIIKDKTTNIISSGTLESMDERGIGSNFGRYGTGV